MESHDQIMAVVNTFWYLVTVSPQKSDIVKVSYKSDIVLSNLNNMPTETVRPTVPAAFRKIANLHSIWTNGWLKTLINEGALGKISKMDGIDVSVKYKGDAFT